MSARGLAGRGVPSILPKWLLFLKIAILLLALVVLALAAYTISLYGDNYGYGYATYYGTGAPGLLIFVAIKTFIVFGVALAVEIWAPNMFFRIIALIAYILGVIFWLSAWAWAASMAAAFMSASSVYRGSLYRGDDVFKKAGSAMAAAAALGAFAWILSIVNLVFFVRACLRDPDNNSGAHQQAELGQVPYKAQEAQAAQPGQQVYPAPYQPPTAYQQPGQQPTVYQSQPAAYQQQQPYATQ